MSRRRLMPRRRHVLVRRRRVSNFADDLPIAEIGDIEDRIDCGSEDDR